MLKWHNNSIDNLRTVEPRGVFSENLVVWAVLMASCAEWLEERYSEVAPWAFYRDLFPSGCLDKRDAKTKGKYCGIAVQIDGKKALRYTLTDELDNLEALLSSDLFTVISPISYAGKSQKAENQREIYAIAIDLDSIVFDGDNPSGLASLISQIDRAKILPKPTYIVASSPANLHLYYLLEEPIKAFASVKESVARYKEFLTKKSWNMYVTKDYDKPQIEPIGQAMRSVGSICKNAENGRVRAFIAGDKVSIDYLNSFVGIDDKDKYSIVTATPKRTKNKSNNSRKLWIAKNGLYEWWIRKMREGASVGHRYYCCLCAAAFAKKSGVSYEQLKEDILELVPFLDDLKENAQDTFTVSDALAAIKNYKDPKFHTMRRDTLERLSAIAMPPNKRNGRPQAIHLQGARFLQSLDDPQGNWRNLEGAPKKRDLVLSFAKEHPNMSNREIAKELGISRNTVNKWMKECGK